MLDDAIILDRSEENTVYIEKDLISWNNEYNWRVRPIYQSGEVGDWIGTSNFSILGSTLPSLDIDIYNEDLNQDELIMFGQFSPYFAVGVVDKMGNEIWNTQVAYMNHVNDYGQLYGVTQIGNNKGCGE